MIRSSSILVALGALLPAGPLLAAHIELSPGGDGAKVTSELVAAKGDIDAAVVHFTLGSLDYADVAGGEKALSAKGLVASGTLGEPELLHTGATIVVPAGYEPRVTVVNHAWTVVPNAVVRAHQHKYRCGVGHGAPIVKSRVYDQGGLFPSAVASVEELGYLQSARLARVVINPVRQDFDHKGLVVTTSLDVKVDFVPRPDASRTATVPAKLPKTLYEMTRKLAINGAEARELAAAAGPETMLVITADGLKDALAPFIAWKQQKGVTVDVATVTQAGGTNTAIKAYIQSYYDAHAVKPTYLLFVGNGDTMPPFSDSTSSGDAATDYDYTLLTPNSKVPSVLYGRFVADSADDLAHEIARLIAYEKAPDLQDAWFNKGTTIASDQGDSPSDKEYAQQISGNLTAHTYKAVDGLYQGDQLATAANITKALNEGRTWLAYVGHGDGTEWASTNDTFDTSTIQTLNNADKLPFIIDVACENGGYNVTPNCFGKTWVTAQSGGKDVGAVAYLGATVSISWNPPAVMSVGISKYHFEKALTTMGASVAAGQMYLMEQSGTGADVIENLVWYTLFGDPSMVMHTDTAKTYTIDRQISGQQVTITATDAGGAGVAGLTVAVADATGAPVVGTTDATGKAVIVLPNVDGAMTLTVSGYNADTYQVALQ